MLRRYRFVFLYVVSCLACVGQLEALVLPTPVIAEEVSCIGLPVTVSATLPEDVSSVCKGAKQAIEFLQKVGLKIGAVIKVEVVTGPNEDVASQTYGCYDFALAKVRLWDYETCSQRSKNSKHFGQQMTRAMYESFIAHEVGHAIAEKNFEARTESRLAHEYIAYATQFATMDNALRERILRYYRDISITHLHELTYATWIISPELFAVRCYKHFLNPENGPEFIRSLLDGSRQLYQLESPF